MSGDSNRTIRPPDTEVEILAITREGAAMDIKPSPSPNLDTLI
jgi:hypothetical protein